MIGRGDRIGPIHLAVAATAVMLLAASPAAAKPLTVNKSTVLRGAEKAPPASAAKKKKKKRGRATTRTAATRFSNRSASATAACTGKSHLTGGGFAASPKFTPGSGGLPTMSVVSWPAGKKDWVASSRSFLDAPGSFTTFARCESNKLGKTVRLSLSGTVPAFTTTNVILDCPPTTHAVGGGYAGTPPTTPSALIPGGLRTVVLQSRRTQVGQWTVTVVTVGDANENPPNPPPTAISGFVICERDGKRKNVTEASTVAAIPENGRAEGSATCGGKRHVVSGGFNITDSIGDSSVAAALDESHPVDRKGWHVGLWEHFLFAKPANAKLHTFAYCKKVPKKKKKKK